jgi:hypothetical protein
MIVVIVLGGRYADAGRRHQRRRREHDHGQRQEILALHRVLQTGFAKVIGEARLWGNEKGAGLLRPLFHF